ncbi:MAG TPA: hypothetical protein VFU60_15575 [Ktedonobacterales bacterium]|nr:hypothetical protein [Ktedonobacterales bacterium]
MQKNRVTVVFRAGVLSLVVLASLLLGLGPGSAPAARAAPPSQAGADINIQRPATLGIEHIGFNVDVKVQVTYRCTPAADGDTAGTLEVFVSQGLVEGHVIDFATCDGRGHVAEEFVIGFVQRPGIGPAPSPFTPGAASANAVVQNADGSAFAEQTSPIMIES